ncbi:unnamed protein product [Penicillium salamii]|nr:unnamed protein product [Penicillium salamii]
MSNGLALASFMYPLIQIVYHSGHRPCCACPQTGRSKSESTCLASCASEAMGNSQSSPAKDESRRANRLSKPLTKRLIVPPPEPEPEPDNSSFGSGLIGWQNPWVGHNISSPVEKRGSYPKKAEIPPTLFETESPEESPTEEQGLNYNPAIDRRRSARPRLMTAGSRRTSYQSETCSQTSPVSEQAPSRASSTRTALQRHNSAVYDNTATSSNTHFLVGNQRFSLTRRRSLLTRPGVATRRASASIRRVPSPIGEPEHQNHDNVASTTLQWPLPLTQRAPSPVRPTSPTDTRYTQLGALKLGSLRVVNASPCPSDRTTLSGTSAPVAGLGLEDLEVAAPNRGATLEIPCLPDLKKSDDLPGSPFSFENSPTITVAPRAKTLFPTYPEDEGILLFDDTRTQLEKSASGADLARSTSRSLNKSDSGYSSATSVHSMQRSRTQSSAGSQTSVSCGGDSVKSVWVSNGPMYDRSGVEMQRQLSVQSKPENYSRLHLTATRWYDASNDPAPLATSRSRRSTLCAPRYTEYTPRDFTVEVRPSGVEPPYLSQPQQRQQGLTRGPFYGDRLSVALSEGPPSSSSSSATWNSHSSQQTMTGSNERLRKSASEYSMHEGFYHHHSRTKSRSGRVWTKKPGVEAPPLPTILSPGYLQDDLDHELNIEVVNSEPMRGRPRSRSQDYRRRRLSKPRPQADTCI